MKTTILRLFQYVLWFYYVLLFIWIAAFLLTGDRFAPLAVINLVAVYLFFLLPLGIIGALIIRKPALWVSFCAAFLAFLFLWGDLFIPSLRHRSNPDPQLKLMTYNVLAWHTRNDAIIAAIRSENPDVVFIQELNTALAQQLRSELSTDYPYQVFAAQDNPRGAGTISKYPLQTVSWEPEHAWFSLPQVLDLSWNGRTVRLVNFHMQPTTRFISLHSLSQEFRRREAQARDLVGLASSGLPMILGGDANAAPLSQAYRIFASTYKDAWRAAGFGLGHSFPTAYIAPGKDRNNIAGFEIPAQIVRIDYLFYSSHWKTLSAWLGPEDGVSDHRSVVAILAPAD